MLDVDRGRDAERECVRLAVLHADKMASPGLRSCLAAVNKHPICGLKGEDVFM